MDKITLTQEEQLQLEKAFPFEYVGGGYFRLNSVPRGTTAPTLHGDEAILYLFKQLTQSKSN